MSFLQRVKQYYGYSKEEIKHFIILAVVFGFLLSFNEWGEEVFELTTGLVNLLIGIIVAGIGIFVHDAGHRFYALYERSIIEAKIWWSGLGLSALFCVVSRGTLNLFVAESIEIKPIKAERLGEFEYRMSIEQIGLIAMMGSFANIVFATLLKFIAILGGISGGILYKMMVFNVIYGVVHWLPFPPLDGMKVLFFTRWFYFFSLVALFVFGYLLLTEISLWVAFILAVLLGGVAAIMYLSHR